MVPESLEVQIFPVLYVISTAASLVPSLDEVMLVQDFVNPRAFQVSPESVEIMIFPAITAAASFVPSLEDAMHLKFCFPLPVRSVQVAPESVEVHI